MEFRFLGHLRETAVGLRDWEFLGIEDEIAEVKLKGKPFWLDSVISRNRELEDLE